MSIENLFIIILWCLVFTDMNYNMIENKKNQ